MLFCRELDRASCFLRLFRSRQKATSTRSQERHKVKALGTQHLQLEPCKAARQCSSREWVSGDEQTDVAEPRAHMFARHTAPRQPSAQGFMNHQQHPQHPQHAMGSPMLSPPVGFSPQQARGGSPGQFHPQGTMAPRSPGAMQAQTLPNMHMPPQQPGTHPNQDFVPRPPSYNNAQDVNGLEQHMSHMNMGSPGLQGPNNIPYVGMHSL